MTYLLDDKEFYTYTDEDRFLLSLLNLKENDLGRYRSVDIVYHNTNECIVVTTRDGADYEYWSQRMLNHTQFFQTVVCEDESYLEYWFIKPENQS